MPTQTEITAAVLTAAFKDSAVKTAKAALEEGQSIEGEIIARIPFRLTKGFKGEMAPTASVLSKAVLAKALVYAGATSEAIMDALLKAATEALEEGGTVAEELRRKDPRVVAMEKVLDAVIAKMPKTPKAGSVSVKVLTDDGLPEIEKYEVAA